MSDVENLGGYLTTVVARVCLNMLHARTSRRQEPLGGHMPQPIVSRADALDPEHEALLADAVAAKIGGIDIFVRAISVMHDQGTELADLSLDEFMRPIDGFLRPLFITSKAVARHMGHKRPGVILTFSEAGGAKLNWGGFLGHAVSCAGKEVFSRILAAELGPKNIRVICIRPHAIIDAPAAGSYTKDLFKSPASAAGLSVEDWMEFCTLRKLDRFLIRYFLLHNRRSSAVSLIAALLVF